MNDICRAMNALCLSVQTNTALNGSWPNLIFIGKKTTIITIYKFDKLLKQQHCRVKIKTRAQCWPVWWSRTQGGDQRSVAADDTTGLEGDHGSTGWQHRRKSRRLAGGLDHALQDLGHGLKSPIHSSARCWNFFQDVVKATTSPRLASADLNIISQFTMGPAHQPDGRQILQFSCNKTYGPVAVLLISFFLFQVGQDGVLSVISLFMPAE